MNLFATSNFKKDSYFLLCDAFHQLMSIFEYWNNSHLITFWLNMIWSIFTYCPFKLGYLYLMLSLFSLHWKLIIITPFLDFSVVDLEFLGIFSFLDFNVGFCFFNSSSRVPKTALSLSWQKKKEKNYIKTRLGSILILTRQ